MPESTTAPSSRFRLPISLRLTLWYGLSMFVLVGLFAGLLITIVHWQQHNLMHQRLFSVHSEVMAHVAVDDGRPYLDPALNDFEGMLQVKGPLGVYVRLVSPEGRVWEQSINFGDDEAFRPQVPAGPRFAEIDLEWHGQPLRTSYAPILADDVLVGWLEVSSFSRDFGLHRLGRPVGIAILLTVLLALGGGYVLARRALRPVVRLTEAANRITASELTIQLPVETRWRDELTDLAETFNTMIVRLGSSFARERRFTADAAHELLNPLAAVRNEAEVALRRPRETAAYRQTLQTILTDVERLGKMVEQLLQLARIDADADLHREAIDLSRLGPEATARWQPTASDKQVALTCRAEQPAFVRANAVHLDAVVDNLLENALKYTPAGGTVVVAIATDDASVVLSVTDSGIGFEPEAADRLFDRFHRAATPDVHAQPGSGLGLAIVRAIVQAYGGSITASSEGPDWGSCFMVRFPRWDGGGVGGE